MKHLKTILCWSTTCALLLISTAAAAQRPAYRPGELLIQFRPHAQTRALDASVRGMGMRAMRSLGNGRIQQMALPEGMSVEAALAAFANDPDVIFAEPNYLLTPQAIPDDPQFVNQWGLHNVGQLVAGFVGTPGADIDAVPAWDEAAGGEAVTVAVIDTGCNAGHPDLAASIWTNEGEIPDNGEDDDGNGYIDDVHGWDFTDNDNLPQDASGHGTHVAGIIGAQSDNGRGIAGIAWQARIMPLRFMNGFDEGTVADAISAIQYAVANGARIINCSWGSTGYSTSLFTVMAGADALFVCAAGNNANNNDASGFYPAGYALGNVLAVAASDQADHLAWFSNFGRQTVHVAAPGSRILSLGLDFEAVWADDFSGGDLAPWSTGGSPQTWTIREAPYYPGSTTLAVTSADAYGNDADTWARSPELGLAGKSGCRLTFRLIGAAEAGHDYLYPEVSTDGAVWHGCAAELGGTIYANGITGTFPYWTTARLDLGAWDGAAPFFLRFRFHSDAANTAGGYYLDDIALQAASAGDTYQSMSGTSMAAAFASGTAALVKSRNSALTPLDLKSILLSSLDLDQTFSDITSGGGRINAFNALTLLGDLFLSADSEGTDRVLLSWIGQATLSDPVTVERRAEDEPAFQAIGQINASAVTYTDDDVRPGTTYYYRVLAATTDGRSGYSNQSLATTTTELATSAGGGGGGGGGGGCFIGVLTTAR